MIFLDNRKIFISGGAGVIGTELVKRLDKRGADLFVGDLKLGDSISSYLYHYYEFFLLF